MQIRNIRVCNFRGIQKMDWTPGSTIACLIGRGDSTKSTILDAIEFALTPKWNLQFSDTDFFECDVSKPIEIEVTVGNLPTDILKDNRFGLEARGWTDEQKLRDEPEQDDERVLTIRLKVDDSLEPTWHVINERNTEGRPISAKDRELLGVIRLIHDSDRNLSWGRGSALTRLAGDHNTASQAIANIFREVRKTNINTNIQNFKEAATQTEAFAKALGVTPKNSYQLSLDTKALGTNSAISLHDGEVPLRMAGLGTRRLVTLALQKVGIKNGAIVLMDEIEHGLEPHRVRHLVKTLKNKAKLATPDSTSLGQVILTTHSPTALVELQASDLNVVRSATGVTTVQQVSSKFQGGVRSVTESLLGCAAIVCEGATEVGLCRGVEDYWAKLNDGAPLAHKGVVISDGKGGNGPNYALGLAQLGYKIALFRDSDVTLTKTQQTDLKNAGVFIFEWKDEVATEQRIAEDIPWATLTKFVEMAADRIGKQEVYDSIGARIGGKHKVPITQGIDSFLKLPIEEKTVRIAIGNAAKDKGWFKRIDLMEELSKIIASTLPSIPTSDLTLKLTSLGNWAYDQ